jgi:hypothetical protein
MENISQKSRLVRKCFVISPIGQEGSAVREHADDVFDYIIKPAMEECGIQPFRADHMREPGMISEQMFQAILSEDLCVAVLTGHNPNVFYELAVAQCAGRPVIVLLEKGQELPFDIRNMRCVYYDLKPRSLFDRVYVKEVVAHIKAFEKAGWQSTNLFGGMSLGVGNLQEQDIQCFEKAIDYGSPEKWLHHLENTVKVFELMGISLRNTPWRQCKGFAELLQKKAAAGCETRILIMHKDNALLHEIISKDAEEESSKRIAYDVQEMFDYFSSLAAKHKNIHVRRITRGFPYVQLTRTDEHVLFIQYLYGEKTLWCPLWRCSARSPLYAKMTKEFDYFWRTSEETVA